MSPLTKLERISPAAPTDESPASDAGVLFPTIGGGRTDLLKAACMRVREWDNKERPVRAPGFPVAIEVLLDARADEKPTSLELGVLVRMERRDFAGDSFGLALALADKFVRFGRAEPNRTIIATGALVPGGQGRLDRVGGFREKTLGILERAGTDNLEDVLYVFAKANEKDLTEDVRTALEAARRDSGFESRSVGNLSELSDLWLDAAGYERPQLRQRRLGVAIGAFAGVVIAATTALFWLRPHGPAAASPSAPSPVVACMNGDLRDTSRRSHPGGENSGEADLGLDARLDRNPPVYPIGKHIVLRASVARAAYIRIVDLDKDGRVQLIYPGDSRADTPLPPEQLFRTVLAAAPPTGPNLMEVFASEEPMNASGVPSANPAVSTGWQEKMLCLSVVP